MFNTCLFVYELMSSLPSQRRYRFTHFDTSLQEKHKVFTIIPMEYFDSKDNGGVKHFLPWDQKLKCQNQPNQANSTSSINVTNSFP